MPKLSSIAKYCAISGLMLLSSLTLSASTIEEKVATSTISGEVNVPSMPSECHENPAKSYKSPWMIYSNDPTRMHILFETDTGVDNDHNHIGIQFDQSGVSCSRSYYKMAIDNKPDRRLWTFSCSGFESNKTYSFTISYRDWYSSVIDYCWYHEIGWFRTPYPDDYVPQELKFYGYGDTRAYDSTTDLAAIAQQIYEHHNSHGNEGAFIIHTGDIVPDGGNVANKWGIDRWQKSFWDVGHVRSMLAQLPIFTTVGNHDFACDVCVSPDNPLGCNDCVDDFISYQNTMYEIAYQPHYYYRYFNYPMYEGRPSGSSDLGNFYYSFHWGPAGFYSLTTYPMVQYCTYSPSLTQDSDQYKWLEKSLKDFASEGRPWKVVFMHAPPYDAAGDSGCHQHQIRDNLIPLFEKYGVDLVLTGHEHYYGRITFPRPNDKSMITEGITYMVLGGGGATLEPFCCPEDMDVALGKDHFAYFEIQGDIMTVTTIDENGNTFDTFTIDKTPKADFQVRGATMGFAPLEVQFENLSTGHISNYEWDFGDGITTTTELSPTHTYQDWGYYTVTLSVDSGFTYDFMTKPNLVRVGYDAGFSAYPNKGPAPLTVEFEPFDFDTEYSHWDFGDGTSLEVSGTVTHTYIGSPYGNITVSHTVGDDSGNRITMTKHDLIKVEPYADFRWEVDPNSRYDFHFYDESRGGSIFSRDWIFGDQTGSGEQNPEHDYSAWGPDILDVELDIVFDDASRDETVKKIIIPAPDEYDASFFANQTKGLPPFTVKLSPSIDYPYNFWDFGDSNYSDEPGTVSHTYDRTGIFTVTHTTGYGSQLNTTLVKPDFIKVALHAGFSAYPSRGTSPLTVEFIPFVDYPYHSWDFGDGTTLKASGPVSHTYESPQYGSFTVAHTVGNDAGYRTTLTKQDLIKVEPYADFRWEVDPSARYNFRFYDESKGGGLFSWDWSFGDQTGSGEQNPVHDYSWWGPDVVDVELDVVFNDASRDETAESIIIPAPDDYDAEFTARPSVGPAPLSVRFTPSTDYPYHLWDFGDGQFSDDPGTVSHTYGTLGTYTVTHTTGYGPSLNTTLTEAELIQVTQFDADFTGFPTTGYITLTVEFTPSVDYPYHFWDFGDGATLQASGSVTHTYETTGTFTVKHTTGYNPSENNTLTKYDYIVVKEFDADFSGVPLTGLAPLIVEFTPSTEYSYHFWDFGDGVTLQASGVVSHTYQTSGIFTVIHKAGNSPDDATTLAKHDYIVVHKHYEYFPLICKKE